MLIRRSSTNLSAREQNLNVTQHQITCDIATLKLAVLCLGGLGGSGKVATEVAQGLSSAGAAVSLITSPQAQWLSNNTSLRYIPASVPKTPTAPDSSWVEPLVSEITKYVELNNTSVLNVHYAVGLLEAALRAKENLVARGRKLAICLTLHGSDVTGFGRQVDYAPKLRDNIQACDSVTAVSHWLADTAVEILSLEKRPTVIHNAINLETFRPKKQKNCFSDVLTLCHVSNFRSVKRPLDAISVAARLSASGLPVRLLMIGDGPLATEAREYARKLNIAQKVIFVGASSADEVTNWFGVSDLLLVTSESESFSLAALEAMACGVPVIGSRCGGLEEVIAELGGSMADNLLSDIGDVDAMAAKIMCLYDMPMMYQILRERILASIGFCFSRNAQLQAYADIICNS